MAQEPGGWYESLLAIRFDDPRELMVAYTFGNGVPSEPSVRKTIDDLSYWEKAWLEEQMGSGISGRSVQIVPRETVEQVLLTYLELTPEDLDEMEYLDDLPYLADTDCYYIVQNSYNYITPYFYEGYNMPDGTIVLYYVDALGSLSNVYRAVLRQTEDGIYKILEITKADVDFTE